MLKKPTDKQVALLVCVGLAVAILVAYEPVRHNGFVEYDDNSYVTKNPNVNAGLSFKAVAWAFTKSHAANWHPLTWLSHTLDCGLFGLRPLGHHVVNVLLHIANSILLFLLLKKMTGALWRSAFVAAVFALHPAHVESVAWVAERKDVLSSLFWMLTIFAYVEYARQPGVRRYLIVVVLLCLGLLSKPMVVTLPFVLLLLDYWPLQRIIPRQAVAEPQPQEAADAQLNEATAAQPVYSRAPIKKLIVEKIPLFVLVAISCIITFIAQHKGHAVTGLEGWPVQARIINAFGAYAGYVLKMIYPVGLAVFYPGSSEMHTDAALFGAMGIVLVFAKWSRGRPWVTVGMLWYLGTLVPVIGLVQVGAQIMADRYTYLPSIGLLILVAWGADEILSRRRPGSPPRRVAGLAATTAIVICMIMTRTQVGYWHDSLTLFGRAIDVTKNNFVMQNNYGGFLIKEGRYDEAMPHFEEAVRICPEYLVARQNICITLVKQRRWDEAIGCYTQALQERTDWEDIHEMYSDLGYAYEMKGNLEQAELNYKMALSIKPDYANALKNLASLLAKQGRLMAPRTGTLSPQLGQ